MTRHLTRVLKFDQSLYKICHCLCHFSVHLSFIKTSLAWGGGGGQLVSMLAFYSNDSSSNPTEAYGLFWGAWISGWSLHLTLIISICQSHLSSDCEIDQKIENKKNLAKINEKMLFGCSLTTVRLLLIHIKFHLFSICHRWRIFQFEKLTSSTLRKVPAITLTWRSATHKFTD